MEGPYIFCKRVAVRRYEIAVCGGRRGQSNGDKKGSRVERWKLSLVVMTCTCVLVKRLCM